MNELPRIGLPSWRESAISRLVNIYDDPELADGQPVVKVKRGASDMERFNALLELLDELYPEASGLVRSSKATPKNRLTAVLGRLNEISAEGRTFKATSATTYDWTDAEEAEEEQPKPKPKPRKPAPASDEAIRAVVKATEKPEDKPKTQTRKAPAKGTSKPAPKTRTRSK